MCALCLTCKGPNSETTINTAAPTPGSCRIPHPLLSNTFSLIQVPIPKQWQCVKFLLHSASLLEGSRRVLPLLHLEGLSTIDHSVSSVPPLRFDHQIQNADLQLCSVVSSSRPSPLHNLPLTTTPRDHVALGLDLARLGSLPDTGPCPK
ncbi:hypothetical protein J6590_030448 [Homalodisca vitripennis]|nr:hypothetical protein J6590_030448 [Homalodisca vitripennis]